MTGDDRTPRPPGPWVGPIVGAVGLLVVGVALFADDTNFAAPRWVVGVTGGLFVAGGVAALTPRRPALATLLGAAILSAFAAIFGWWVVVAGPESTRVSGTLPLGWLPRGLEHALFYAVVGGFTLVVGGLSVVAWAAALRLVAARLPPPLDRLLLTAAGLLFVVGLAWLGLEAWRGEAGPREPLVALAFDGSLEDAGPHHARASPVGDEVVFVPGIRGQALFVGGSEDWVDYAIPPAVDLSRSVTVELWLRREDWVNPYRAGSLHQTVVTIGHLTVNLRMGDPVRVVGRVGDTVVAARDSPVVPATWIHVGLVYDRRWSAARLYLDGRLVERVGVIHAPRLERQDSLRIGTWHRANQAFRGAIDEVRVYGYARGEGELAACCPRRG